MKRENLIGIAVASVVGCAVASGGDNLKGDPPPMTSPGSSDSGVGNGSQNDASGKATTPSCSNGLKDSNEDDIDCGGACPPCGDGAKPSCVDGKPNGLETDVDCGGDCPPCDRGSKCKVAGDCSSSICTDGACCVENDYQKTSGFQYSGYTICCDGEDERTGVIDCGDGDSHSATASGGNCNPLQSGMGPPFWLRNPLISGGAFF